MSVFQHKTLNSRFLNSEPVLRTSVHLSVNLSRLELSLLYSYEKYS